MILAMTLLARDEEDIIGENIAFHLEQGVDHVIVTDNLSVDGTPDIVNEYVKQGVATYVAEKGDDFRHAAWVTRMARMMAARYGAPWIINADADEFWLPPEGRTLKTYFSRLLLTNVVEAPRRTFVCVKDDGRPFWRRMVYARPAAASDRALDVKIAHRGSTQASVAAGARAVDGVGRQRVKRGGLEVAHFPLRSRAQYLNKLRNAGPALAAGVATEAICDAWRARYEELRATGSVAWLDESIMDEATLKRMIDAGEVALDRRVEAHLTRKRAASPRRFAIAAL